MKNLSEMTHKLQTLLGLPVNNPVFDSCICQLESAAGNSSVDVKLIADILAKSHSVMKSLGLHIRDTTGRELYYALNASVLNGTAEKVLSDTDYVLVQFDGQIISMNLIDVIENSHHELPFGRQIICHGQRSLRGELLDRYSCHPRTDEITIRGIVELMGLLPEADECYNKHNNNQGGDK